MIKLFKFKNPQSKYWPTRSFENFEQFLYIKYQLFKI